MLPAEFVEKFGGRYRSFRAGWLIQCPFPEHRDSTPSCSVSGSGLFHCFGCGKKGNFATLLHDVAGFSWAESYRQYRVIASTYHPEPKIEQPSEPSIAELGFFDVNWHEAAMTYHAHLGDTHRPPWAFPLERGMQPETLMQFQVGYDEATQRLVIPVFTPRGAYHGYVTRGCIPGDFKYKVQPPLQTASCVYNIHSVTGRESTVYVVEGLMDVWALTQVGILPVVGIFGTHVSDVQREHLLRAHQHFTVVFDGDKAGRYGAEVVASRLYRAGAAVNIAQTWRAGVHNIKHLALESLRTLIQSASPYPSFSEVV